MWQLQTDGCTYMRINASESITTSTLFVADLFYSLPPPPPSSSSPFSVTKTMLSLLAARLDIFQRQQIKVQHFKRRSCVWA